MLFSGFYHQTNITISVFFKYELRPNENYDQTRENEEYVIKRAEEIDLMELDIKIQRILPTYHFIIRCIKNNLWTKMTVERM